MTGKSVPRAELQDWAHLEFRSLPLSELIGRDYLSVDSGYKLLRCYLDQYWDSAFSHESVQEDLVGKTAANNAMAES
jgi:hypothetical protein